MHLQLLLAPLLFLGVSASTYYTTTGQACGSWAAGRCTGAGFYGCVRITSIQNAANHETCVNPCNRGIACQSECRAKFGVGSGWCLVGNEADTNGCVCTNDNPKAVSSS